jgi:hypothetical protein
MTDERFNDLINGPLDHPMITFKLTRLILALRTVVEMTGASGDKALEAVCRERELRDRAQEDV